MLLEALGLSNVNNQSGIIIQGENLELSMLCLRKANKLMWWLYRGIVKDDLERGKHGENLLRAVLDFKWETLGRGLAGY